MTMIHRFFLVTAITLSLCATSFAQTGEEIIADTGVTGGVIVHLGCGDGRLTTELCRGKSFVVQGLDRSAANIKLLRDRIQSQSLHGRVSANLLTGSTLPFTDNLVTLLVSEDQGDISMDEINRVLSPGGMAYLKRSGKWAKTVKPWPEDIDEWTHYLHDASGNAVADDQKVGPPRHMQWVASPSWMRHHHSLASVSAVVSTKGRIFFIADEGSRAAVEAPGKWAVHARDAFNGVLLWKHPIAEWADHTQKFRSGPVQLERILVARDERVYVTLALDAAVSILDAATGSIVAVCEGTEKAEEVILQGNTLYVLTGSPVSEQRAAKMARRGAISARDLVAKTIVAVDATSGKKIWAEVMEGPAKPISQTLAADTENIYFQTLTEAIALDGKTGEQLWATVTAKPARPKKDAKAKNGRKPRQPKPTVGIGWSTATLVVNGGVVLTANQSAIHAIDAATGKKLWQAACKPGFRSPPDVLVVNDVVWAGPNFGDGRDLRTGEVVRQISYLNDLRTAGHHHRCYRDKATTNFLLGGYRGIEFMDLKGDNHSRNNWIRGVCQYGVMPSNGLVYAPPHQCACFMESKLYGFWAVAPASQSASNLPAPGPRLRKGPAYESALKTELKSDPEGWPMHRQGSSRGNAATTAVPETLQEKWSTRIGGSLTAPVAAAGKVVLARREAGEVVALDQATGRISWRYAVAGRIDSAPTIHGDLVLFGSADGHVYCLRLNDGDNAWTFRAAPAERQTIAFDQLESVWPVHGSVLIQNDVAWFTAGRNSYLDGGLHLFAIDPRTGAIKSNEPITSAHPGVDIEARDQFKPKKLTQNATDYKTFTAPDRSDAFSMAGSMSDILVGDGESIYLRQTRYNSAGIAQADNGMHLFCTSRLVDGHESQRSYMVYGSGDFSRTPVAFSWLADGRSYGGKQLARPYGVTMAFDKNMVYSIRSLWARAEHSGYRLYGWDLRDQFLTDASEPDFRVSKNGKKATPAWEADIAVRPRGILLSADRLYVGGMPNKVGGVTEKALDGTKGGVISVLSATDGRPLTSYELATAPVWDGIAAANKQLFITSVDGAVRCLGD